MTNYLISRPSEVNTTNPTILGGKINSFEIVSTEPDISNYISVDENTGALTYTGLPSPNVSLVTVEGSNDNSSYFEEIYAITPIGIDQGSISAGTTYNFSVPNSGTPVTIEFTSGGTVPNISGGFFSIIPEATQNILSGTSLTGNVLTTDYYLSEAVSTYSFVTEGINISFPLTLSLIHI